MPIRTPASPFSPRSWAPSQYGIAFRADDKELCASIEGAVKTLVDNGTYAKIAEKYPDIVNNLLFLN